MNRPAIPTEIRRKVLIEAGHRCAIPTCRYIEVDIHHIIPWADCQTHEYDNLIALCPNCHRRAGNEEIDRKSLRLYKNNLRFIHEKFSQLELDILFDLYKQPVGANIQWPPFMNILIRRIIEAGFINVAVPKGSITMSGMQMNPANLSITVKGREYVESLSQVEF